MKTTAAQTAKAIKKELGKEFPAVKFSVKSQVYSGGSSVDVEWTDGPTTEQVETIVGKYEYGHFNGMDDMYEISNSREDIPQVKYVMTRRSMSQQVQEQLRDHVAQNYVGAQGVGYFDFVKEQGEYFNTLVHRIFCKNVYQ